MKFSGQGPVYLAIRQNDGKPGAFFDIGCADELSVAMAVTKWTHKETCSGQRAVDATGEKEKTVSVTLTMTEWKTANIELATRGVAKAAATGSVTNEELPDALVAGDYVALGGQTPRMGITALTIVDSDSPPNAVALNTNYTVNADTGLVKIVSVAGLTQPLVANYTYADQAFVAMLAAGAREYWLRYDYLNGQNANGPGVAELYRVKFDPTSSLPLINEEYLTFTLAGEVLIDTTQDADGDLGQFGRISEGVAG